MTALVGPNCAVLLAKRWCWTATSKFSAGTDLRQASQNQNFGRGTELPALCCADPRDSPVLCRGPHLLSGWLPKNLRRRLSQINESSRELHMDQNFVLRSLSQINERELNESLQTLVHMGTLEAGQRVLWICTAQRRKLGPSGPLKLCFALWLRR